MDGLLVKVTIRNQMDLRLLLRGGDLTSYRPTSEESLGLRSSNNLDTGHHQLRPGIDINSALELQDGMVPTNPSASSLFPTAVSSMQSQTNITPSQQDPESRTESKTANEYRY